MHVLASVKGCERTPAQGARGELPGEWYSGLQRGGRVGAVDLPGRTLACLHSLGCSCRPLRVDSLVTPHAARFLVRIHTGDGFPGRWLTAVVARKHRGERTVGIDSVVRCQFVDEGAESAVSSSFPPTPDVLPSFPPKSV